MKPTSLAPCLRVEQSGNGGFACVRQFLRSGLDEQIVTLRAPDHRDAVDYECPAMALTMRLVRHVASTGKVRVLMTNLPDSARYPAWSPKQPRVASRHAIVAVDGVGRSISVTAAVKHPSAPCAF
ncbi:hypothetical protein [Paraburkholderia sp. UCT31]|uniref:hypothetical protein n=1 Tax=Paraburkholderia sp. UCT31 TaxID=2615209 RepID=UPI00223BB5E7|nr:hypothetical protein [Paraburkholderia sp. UCT31]